MDNEEHLSQGAYMKAAEREYARNVGEQTPDTQWILSPHDIWMRNPHYTGEEQPHPEENDDREMALDFLEAHVKGVVDSFEYGEGFVDEQAELARSVVAQRLTTGEFPPLTIDDYELAAQRVLKALNLLA